MEYEGHICRAPMERASYMLPVAVGCSYNACRFCNLFKHLSFRPLSMEKIEAECARVRAVGGRPKKVFLGDGNAFTFPTEALMDILRLVRSYFPDVEMINMDATVTSILEKSDAELSLLYEAGVRHLYLGIETGLDDVLAFMDKDHSLAEAYEAIDRLHETGLIFDAHIMTGIAGRGRGEENAEALAEFFHRTRPAHICNFSLFLQDEVPLGKDIREGRFFPASELENLIEDRLLVKLLSEGDIAFVKYDSLHDYIGKRVRGTLPGDSARMLAALDTMIAEEAEEEERSGVPLYANVYGECPSLFDVRSGRYMWDADVLTGKGA